MERDSSQDPASSEERAADAGLGHAFLVGRLTTRSTNVPAGALADERSDPHTCVGHWSGRPRLRATAELGETRCQIERVVVTSVAGPTGSIARSST